MSPADTFKLPFIQSGHKFFNAKNLTVLKSKQGMPPYVLDIPNECSVCGEYPDLEVLDTCIIAIGECSMPEGITTTITLNVPSGKIIVTDDLRPVYDANKKGLKSYNTAAGQAQFVEEMAAIGCAYGPVGNTCPNLIQTGEDTFVISTVPYDEEDELAMPEGWRELAGITTDLWAYSIADFDDWVSKGGEPAKMNWCDTIVDITPGVYEFTHHSGERNFDEDAPGAVIYAHIKRIA